MANSTINPYRFAGQLGYRRDGTNRNYVRARHLNTEKARWISRDAIPLDAAGFNFYWYVKNQPVSLTDPSGLLPSDISGCLKQSGKNCFLCMYQRYTNLRNKRYYNLRYCPKKACDLANFYCHTDFNCTACGPGGITHQRHVPGCLDIHQMPDYARWLHDQCGALPGTPNANHSGDKLAHCWGCCMANMCGGFLGDIFECKPIFKHGSGRDPVEDDQAAQMGRDCSCASGSQTTFHLGEFCLKCCGEKTYNLHCE